MRLIVSTTVAYNDAMAEVQVAGKGRLFAQCLLPFWDIDLTVKELIRCHKMGMTGFTMTDSPESWGLPYLNDPHWDRLWAEAQDRSWDAAPVTDLASLGQARGSVRSLLRDEDALFEAALELPAGRLRD